MSSSGSSWVRQKGVMGLVGGSMVFVVVVAVLEPMMMCLQ